MLLRCSVFKTPQRPRKISYAYPLRLGLLCHLVCWLLFGKVDMPAMSAHSWAPMFAVFLQEVRMGYTDEAHACRRVLQQRAGIYSQWTTQHYERIVGESSPTLSQILVLEVARES